MSEFRGAYQGCNWCYGNGCNQCEAERQKAFEQAQKPIFTAKADNPHDMEILKEVLGREALEHAFGPDGDGMQEIERNAALGSLKQILHSQFNETGNPTQNGGVNE